MSRKPAPPSTMKAKLEALVKKDKRGQKSVYIQDSLWESFRNTCEKEGYSASEVVESLIRNFMEIP